MNNGIGAKRNRLVQERKGPEDGNSILTRGGPNQLKSSSESGLDHLTSINAPFCFAQVEQGVYA